MILTVLLIVAVLTLGAWVAGTAHARLWRRLAAAPRVADARRDLADATLDWNTAAARAAAVTAAGTPGPGFGDSHVVPAKLRRALAQLTEQAEQV